jgi:xanthine dehydrogenase YagS FAD-binding subunit
MMPSFSYVRAASVKEAIRHLGVEGSRACAGGSDLLGCLRDGVFGVGTVVSLGGLDELQGIAETADGGVGIGALTTIAEVAANPLVRQRYRGLAQAASEVASPQLRHQGTLGGNICQKPRCWYYRGDFQCLRKGGSGCYAVDGENQYHAIFGGDLCYVVHPSDTAPALVALQAGVRIAGPNGSRTEPLEGFHVAPGQDPTRETVLEAGEIVTEILLPAPVAGLRSSYRKVRARRAWDFALAGVALALAFEGDVVQRARVVLSGAAPIPWRCPEVEKIIVGQRLDAETVARAQEAVVAGAVPLEHNGYKIPLFRGLVAQQLEAIGA